MQLHLMDQLLLINKTYIYSVRFFFFFLSSTSIFIFSHLSYLRTSNYVCVALIIKMQFTFLFFCALFKKVLYKTITTHICACICLFVSVCMRQCKNDNTLFFSLFTLLISYFPFRCIQKKV
jgi:hypothetical protein